ncbi:methyltransferase domain-containing protein [Anaerofustis stercorihominis]|uniref:rRNA methylase n=1 Tax=Anaerofustis stercorihominis DSM 17244 TaxID=445971 RepID=B1C6T2_9FIRM|nr:class I SAM-dependent methyltransferase [Anaerofustis stercorihominis]EDS72719.1 putative rRNA methylase [Anaerofustis stercorihominis DSM 17244]MCQ4794093.1 methyltransferase domain-containing protein [Anaerofustis stercorihominis]
MFNNVTEITNVIIDNKVVSGNIVLDMTMGNGNDTLYLSKKVGEKGKVYAFDIQSQAVKNTKKLLDENRINNAVLINDSHENVLNYVTDKVDFAVYNLGYLPGGDKKIVTKSSSSVKSIEYVLTVLNNDGIIVICAYVGHEGGMEEYKDILSFVSSLSKSNFNVTKLEHTNRKPVSPKMIIIERIK